MNLTKTITEKLIRNESLSDLDQRLLEHGIEIVISDVCGILGMMVLSYFLHSALETVIYIIAFSALRTYSGGIHARSEWRCFLTTEMIYLVCMFLCRHWNINLLLESVIVIFSCTFIWINAPVIHHLQPLTEEEKKENQKKCRFILMFICISWLILSSYRHVFTFVLLIDAIMMYLLQLQETGNSI